jgi:hypothetical protein
LLAKVSMVLYQAFSSLSILHSTAWYGVGMGIWLL